MPSGSVASPSGGGDPSGLEEWLRGIEVLASAGKGVDTQQVPEVLCRACVRLLPVSGASVSISGGPTARAMWCASDRVAARLAEVQYTLGEGPCQTALGAVGPVLAVDLAEDPGSGRWPVFAHEAVGLGVRAVFSLPLGTDEAAIGTLDMYRDQPGGLSASELAIALWARDAITLALMKLLPHPGSEQVPGDEGAPWMRASQAEHSEVYQAMGIVMVQLGADPEEALDRMRARAFAQGRTVTEVARDVVARRSGFRPE
ncbi:ANTAR domain-containing protein [Streptomyces sp. NPDC088560]|uniref:ANTAR domain-containing protein n=1 Tax=Streptomyces sp. NPDC088560 TaxID=3365868 RepID=UPI003820862B